MSYFDWQHLMKPFRFEPVVQDTTENIKALSITPVNEIKLGVLNINFPAQINIPSYKGGGFDPCVPLIIKQCCYSVGTNFSIINFKQIRAFDISELFLCVRYRVGNTVTRYALQKTTSGLPNDPFSAYTIAPAYTGQIIKGNFVLEVWQKIASSATYSMPPYVLQTGIIYFPTDITDVASTFNPLAFATLSDLQYSLPENTPTAVNANGPWLTN
jgi:hypothetical protein